MTRRTQRLRPAQDDLQSCRELAEERFIRWNRLGVFNRIFADLAAKAGEPDTTMIDATHLKAHWTAASLLKGGLFPDVSVEPRAA